MSFKSPYALCKPIEVFDLYRKIPSVISDLSFRNGYEILDRIRHYKKCSWCDEDSYVVLPSKMLRQLYGRDYINALNELKERRLIECKRLDGEDAGYEYSIKNGIARSFRLKYGVEELFEKDGFAFESRKFTYKMPKLKTGPFSLKKKSKSPKALKLLENYKSISINPDWIKVFVSGKKYPSNHMHHPNEPMAQMGMFMHCSYFVESIYRKKIDVTTDSESLRAFHAVLMMSETIRKYVRVDGEVPVYIDAVSLHPYLIASYIQDKTQKERFLGYLKSDFYKRFTDDYNSRGRIKVLFQKYLSGKKLIDPKAIEIERWFQEEFPDIGKMREKLKKQKTTFQMRLQQLEASIFVDKVFMAFDKWSLPLHDGLMVKQENRAEAISLIRNACTEKLGYEIPLTEKSY